MHAIQVECPFCAGLAQAHPGIVRAANRWHVFVPCSTGLAVACSADGAGNRVVSEHARAAIARAEGGAR